MTFARVRALIIVGVLFVAASVVVVMTLTQDSQTELGQVSNCPSGTVPVDLTMPERKDVALNVYNGTKRANLAARVGNELENREFDVVKTGNAPGGEQYDGIALIRYGPKTVGAGWLMQAYFLGTAEDGFDIERDDDTVDIVIGSQFQQLATTTEVNQSIAQLQEPVLPPGTCDASAG